MCAVEIILSLRFQRTQMSHPVVMSHIWVFLKLDEIGTIAFGISGFTARKQKKNKNAFQ